MITLDINGVSRSVDAPPNMPLVWVLRDLLGLMGPKYGCGIASCGACTVHLNGEARRSCATPVGAAVGKKITTIEGLSPDSSHALQKAWIAEQVPQCGYCQSGQIMSAAVLLKDNPRPSREQIRSHMTANICRCGTYQRIVRAIERAVREG